MFYGFARHRPMMQDAIVQNSGITKDRYDTI